MSEFRLTGRWTEARVLGDDDLDLLSGAADGGVRSIGDQRRR